MLGKEPGHASREAPVRLGIKWDFPLAKGCVKRACGVCWWHCGGRWPSRVLAPLRKEAAPQPFYCEEKGEGAWRWRSPP
jgi:hypothetical protein